MINLSLWETFKFAGSTRILAFAPLPVLMPEFRYIARPNGECNYWWLLVAFTIVPRPSGAGQDSWKKRGRNDASVRCNGRIVDG